MSRIVLASGSPRRKELLEQIGLEFEICPAKGEEIITSSNPSDVVLELSKQKAEEVASMVVGYNDSHQDVTTAGDILVIGADTVVAYDGKILGKPADKEKAVEMLEMLQGKTHQVFTGVTVVFISEDGRTGEKSFFEETKVNMCKMSPEEIHRYVESGEPMDKAGAYAIQGRCAIHIASIEGDYHNVVGLPVSRLYQELLSLGIDLLVW